MWPCEIHPLAILAGDEKSDKALHALLLGLLMSISFSEMFNLTLDCSLAYLEIHHHFSAEVKVKVIRCCDAAHVIALGPRLDFATGHETVLQAQCPLCLLIK